jgi:hypothetical protein
VRVFPGPAYAGLGTTVEREPLALLLPREARALPEEGKAAECPPQQQQAGAALLPAPPCRQSPTQLVRQQ